MPNYLDTIALGLNWIEPRTSAEIMALEGVPDGTAVFATDSNSAQVYSAAHGAWLPFSSAQPIQHLNNPPDMEEPDMRKTMAAARLAWREGMLALDMEEPNSEEPQHPTRKPGRNLLL